jgi:Transglutaminase-like superfamily
MLNRVRRPVSEDFRQWCQVFFGWLRRSALDAQCPRPVRSALRLQGSDLRVDRRTALPYFRMQTQIAAYDTAAVTDDYRRLYFPEDAPNLEPIVHSLREDAARHSSAIGADERLCVEIMRFTTASMALGAPAGLECASATLANALASCGGYAMVMCEIVRVAGLPSRYLGLFGIPSTGSHALVEVHFGGGWHLFDPTFGVFFYSGAKWDGTDACCPRRISSRAASARR